MGKFLTPLRVEQISDSVTEKSRWKLIEPLVYKSNSRGFIIIPEGFITDFASVPRIPIVHALYAGRGDKQAVLHDYLYTAPHRTQPPDPLGTQHGVIVTRAVADCIYRGALTDDLKYNPDFFDNFFMRYLLAHFTSFSMWCGVRAIGRFYWDD